MQPGSIVLLAALSLRPGVGTGAELPDVVNTQLQTRSAAAGLEKEFGALVQGQSRPAWIGYAQPLVPGNHHMCCCDSERSGQDAGRTLSGCRLEREGSFTMNSADAGRASLEGPRQIWVLFRVAQARVMKIRFFSGDCELDAGGLPLYWLTDVRPAESVELLAGFVTRPQQEESADEEDHVAGGAMAAIALTNDPAAARAFDRFVAANQPISLRGQAAFWLGEARGRHGLELLKRMVDDDPSEQVRERAVFGLSISKQSDSLPALIDVAHHGSAGVRGQAIFWLAQKAGKKAAQAITAAIENDPETEVKKKAVFALAQLPPDEGVPLLIKVAQTNRNSEVRRQAMFWLGQSKDSRALAFLEDVLMH
jgi:HEAT repeat protein